MHTRRILAALGLATTTLMMAAPAPADTTAAPGLAAAVTSERGCRELIIPRAANAAALRAVVPERYTLAGNNLTVTTYTCQDVTIDGQATPGPSTVAVGTTGVTQRVTNGFVETLPPFSRYILWYGTDNLTLFNAFRRVGLPAHRLSPDTSATLTGMPPSNLTWAIRGSGLEYDIEAIPTGAPGSRTAPIITYYHDSPLGDLELRFSNDAVQSSATTTANLTGLEPLIPLLTGLQFAVIPLPGNSPPALPYITGGWTSELSAH